MNLIELLYQLQGFDYEAAERFLKDAGVSKTIQEAILECHHKGSFHGVEMYIDYDTKEKAKYRISKEEK